MLLTLTTTHSPATDLGFLLHKNPDRLQTFDLNFGRAYVYYPVAEDTKCTVALLVEIDPVELVRGKKGSGSATFNRPLQPYVNDRPYVASSFMSVALARVFGSALTGKSRTHAELAEAKIPLSAYLAVIPSRDGEQVLHRLFEPLGYRVTTRAYPLDPTFPEWGNSPYFSLTLEANCRLKDLLSHLYVLIPVLDEEKHYWFGEDEVDKLLRHGEGWLATHPEKALITGRYLKRSRLVKDALARLTEEEEAEAGVVDEFSESEGTPETDLASGTQTVSEEPTGAENLNLNQQRLASVLGVLKDQKIKRVADLGCGEGKLLKLLLADPSFEEILGMDVAYRILEKAKARLKLEELPARQQSRIKLVQGSLIYRDKRLAGFEAATVIEVIEHLDPARLAAFERVLFEFARPEWVVVTTPNVEYNAKFEQMPTGEMRHHDHRFEWSREQFQRWAGEIAGRFGYRVDFRPIGPVDDRFGPPTQMAVFRR